MSKVQIYTLSLGLESSIKTMTLPEIIRERGLKKEFVLKRAEIPRNKFYCYQHKMHKFSSDELARLANVIGVDVQVLKDIALPRVKTN